MNSDLYLTPLGLNSSNICDQVLCNCISIIGPLIEKKKKKKSKVYTYIYIIKIWTQREFDFSHFVKFEVGILKKSHMWFWQMDLYGLMDGLWMEGLMDWEGSKWCLGFVSR